MQTQVQSITEAFIMNNLLLFFIFGVFISYSVANNTTDNPECMSNDDCEADRVCAKLKCINPCAAVCGPSTVCLVSNHVAMCSCPAGYSGHPITGCSPSPVSITCSHPGSAQKRFYVESSKKADWHGALMGCLRNNARLASVESFEELQRIRNLIQQTGRRFSSFWVSGSDYGYEGRFLWASTGKPLARSSDLWLPGQPDNGARHDEHCVELWEPYRHQGYGLKDEDCSKKAYFVCEHYV